MISFPKKGKRIKDSQAATRALERDGGRCRVCGATGHDEIMDVHHVVYRSHGGDDIPENLVTLCRKHHDAVHKKRLFVRWDGRGFVFSQYPD